MGVCATLMLGLAGCASPRPMDYTAFKEAKPRSILILPPVNHTSYVKAPYAVLSQMTHPVAEAGYYVIPVVMELETFHQNGVIVPEDMAQIPAGKLRSVFGADAVLYSTVTAYGSNYEVMNSVTLVKISAKLVDLKTGSVLWSGSAAADDSSSGDYVYLVGGPLTQLAAAAVKQVGHTLLDSSYPVAGQASRKLLSAGIRDGWLYGPRSPYYNTK